MRNSPMPIVMLLALAGCGGAEEPPAAEAPPTREPTVFTPMTDTIGRAESVEDTLRDAAAERRRQLDAQE